jgi:hypothetical protein
MTLSRLFELIDSHLSKKPDTHLRVMDIVLVSAKEATMSFEFTYDIFYRERSSDVIQVVQFDIPWPIGGEGWYDLRHDFDDEYDTTQVEPEIADIIPAFKYVRKKEAEQ